MTWLQWPCEHSGQYSLLCEGRDATRGSWELDTVPGNRPFADACNQSVQVGDIAPEKRLTGSKRTRRGFESESEFGAERLKVGWHVLFLFWRMGVGVFHFRSVAVGMY